MSGSEPVDTAFDLIAHSRRFREQRSDQAGARGGFNELLPRLRSGVIDRGEILMRLSNTGQTGFETGLVVSSRIDALLEQQSTE